MTQASQEDGPKESGQGSGQASGMESPMDRPREDVQDSGKDDPVVGEDLVDRMAGLERGGAVQALRQRRTKVAVATQGSYDALFDPALPGLPLADRLLVALYGSLLSAAPALAAHYRERLAGVQVDAAIVGAVERLAFHEAVPAAGDGSADADLASDAAAGPAGGVAIEDFNRLRPLLAFTRMLVENPIAADKAALQSLTAAGLATAAVVALAQLIAFLSYQVRLVAGLRAMQGAALDAPTADAGVAPTRPPQATRDPRPRQPGAVAPATATATHTATAAATTTDAIIRINGFTNEALEWKAWLDVVDIGSATPQQIEVLEESHPQAKVQDYYRLLVHQPEILRQRSAAFNAIMYAPRGLSRAERELGATVTSRINGCVYCASVHARRFEQMARRNEVIRQVFQDPASAGEGGREKAIVQFSIALTESPGGVGADHVRALAHAGLDDLEILDLIHSVAIFAWANRLMLNLGACAAEAGPRPA